MSKKQYTYLVIDDEMLIRKGTIKKLAPLSDRIVCIGEAGNGQDGIEKTESLHPDFVILDMQMPVMNGMELLPRLRDDFPEMTLVVISGYKDFDYIKQAISANAVEYILKPFSPEAIQKCVGKIISQLDQRTEIRNRLSISEQEREQACYEQDKQTLFNLLMGYRQTVSALTSSRLNFINSTHNLILILLHTDQNLTDAHVQAFLDEHAFGDLALYISNPESEHLGAVILFLPVCMTLSDQGLPGQITDALSEWMKNEGIPALISISDRHGALSELHAAYTETEEALDQLPPNAEVPAVCHFSSDTAVTERVWPKTEEFLFRIEAGSKEEVSSLTEEYFQWFLTIPSCTIGDVKYSCYQLSEQCRQVLNNYLRTPSASESMQNIVMHLFTLDELRCYYLQFFTNLNVMIRPMSVYAGDDTATKIQTYMQRNLQKNLTQEFVASLFYLNRSYLSTMFRNKTGEKFTDYLNGLRIQKAEKLLLETEYRLPQIARMVGYDNPKYFFRVFRKYTGTTPEKYRETHLKPSQPGPR